MHLCPKKSPDMPYKYAQSLKYAKKIGKKNKNSKNKNKNNNS